MGIAESRYVSLTTYRRSGEAVPVPVWIAPLDDGRVGFTTDGASGKVRRLRNDPQVTLRPCDVRGNVAPDADEVRATAVVVEDGPDHAAITSAVARKYGIQYRFVVLSGWLKRLIGRSSQPAAVAITLEG